MDNALAEIEAQREAHSQKERDLQIQSQASRQAAEQIPSMRYPVQAQQLTLLLFCQFLFVVHSEAQHCRAFGPSAYLSSSLFVALCAKR